MKRKQAELALSLTAETHLEIRDAISSLNGRQGQYRRLDKDGIVRAIEMRKVSAKLRYRMDSGLEYASLQRQIDELRSAHTLQNIISRCSLLRKGMRQALREGGQGTQTSKLWKDT